MQSKARTPAQYLRSLPADRRETIAAVRKVVNDNLDPKVKEAMTHGMLGWVVPLSVYPAGYHCAKDTPLPFASLASQKNHMALYLFCVYCDPEETERVAREWRETGKRLDMGRSCLRFKTLEDVPLEVIGRAVKRMSLKRFLAAYEGTLAGGGGRAPNKSARKPAGRKAVSKKAPAAKKSAKKVSKKAAASRKKAAPKTTAAGRKAPARKNKTT